MKRSEFDAFEKLVGQLQSVYDELAVLSKKSPNDGVNKFKLGFLNSILVKANDVLSSRYKPFPDFVQFDADDVPQNSDVVFILAQYLQCFEKMRADHVVMRGGAWWWSLEAGPGEKANENGEVLVRTTRPLRLRE